MLEHRAPLDQLSGERAGAAIQGPGLSVAAVADRGLLLIQGDLQDARLADAIREQTQIAVPAPQAAVVRSQYTLLWMAPGQCLLELPAAQASTAQAALIGRIGAALAAVTDVSDAFAGFDVSGDRAPEALMTGCTLDLRPHAFAPGRAARTALADVSVVIWKPDSNRFRCLVERGFAGHFAEWLAQACAHS
jgi:sarcosine oxidase subunit gamma